LADTRGTRPEKAVPTWKIVKNKGFRSTATIAKSRNRPEKALFQGFLFLWTKLSLTLICHSVFCPLVSRFFSARLSMAYPCAKVFLLSSGLLAAALPAVSAHAVTGSFGNLSSGYRSAPEIQRVGFTQNIMSVTPPSSYQPPAQQQPMAGGGYAPPYRAQPYYGGQNYVPPPKGANWIYPTPPTTSMADRFSPFYSWSGAASPVPSMEQVDGYADRVMRYGEKLSSGPGAVDRSSSLAYIEREPTTWRSSSGYRSPMR
jgi:hypothetical protein